MLQVRPQSARDAQIHPVLDILPSECGAWPEPYSRLIVWYSFLYDRHNQWVSPRYGHYLPTTDGVIRFSYIKHHVTAAQHAKELLYPRYRDTHLPFVGLFLWLRAESTMTVLKTVNDPHNMLAPLAAIVYDNETPNAPKDVKDNEQIALTAIGDRGVGGDAYFDRFLNEMRCLHEAEYNVDPQKCITILTGVAKTDTLRPYLAKYDIWQPIVAMCSFYVRHQRARRHSVWIDVYPLFS